MLQKAFKALVGLTDCDGSADGVGSCGSRRISGGGGSLARVGGIITTSGSECGVSGPYDAEVTVLKQHRWGSSIQAAIGPPVRSPAPRKSCRIPSQLPSFALDFELCITNLSARIQCKELLGARAIEPWIPNICWPDSVNAHHPGTDVVCSMSGDAHIPL